MREPSAAQQGGQSRRSHRPAPVRPPDGPLVDLQRQAGNRAVTAFLRGGASVQRAVVAEYGEIQRRLRPGTFGWVSDTDEYWIIRQLIGIPPVDFHDTVIRMQADGVLGTFFAELPSDARSVAGTIIARIERIRDGRMTAEEQLTHRRRLDWVHSPGDADQAFAALRGLSDADRTAVLRAIPVAEYEAWSRLLRPRTDPGELRFLQTVEVIAQGTTEADLAARQRAFLLRQAQAQGKTLEQFLRGEASTRGYGGRRALWWPSLRPARQQRWQQRFTTALGRVRTAAPPEVLAALTAAEGRGGGIRFGPQQVEEEGADTYAYRQGDLLVVGRLWLLTAERNPANVFENIVHELGGHHDYGRELAWDVMLDATTPAERAVAMAGGQSLYSAYGYLETELYAELRELPFRVPGSRGDDPEHDVEDQLRQIHTSYETGVGAVVVRAFRRRIAHDARITPAALALYDRKVRLVFGIGF
ncbi:hypothetical protein ACFYOT_19480 [Saccharothrix saharensis]|uniref:hypothetical protein n=1 Tax=Saccharothrix saharensis TaxID=571190 RepID=UPI003698EBEE